KEDVFAGESSEGNQRAAAREEFRGDTWWLADGSDTVATLPVIPLPPKFICGHACGGISAPP
ncbi:MAG TPA: hypothetical protein VHM91_21635, partial [Verrucomicrobiales bacterium]|nr:hypothetical protein [Verrucomicrobiales bacterium]